MPQSAQTILQLFPLQIHLSLETSILSTTQPYNPLTRHFAGVPTTSLPVPGAGPTAYDVQAPLIGLLVAGAIGLVML